MAADCQSEIYHESTIYLVATDLTALFQDGKFHSEQVDDWHDWLEYLIGFVVCAAIGIVFIIAMPIAGLVFCCCRCCGCCGKSKKAPSKRAKCRRRCYCTVLIILTTVALGGTICAFICNSIIYRHLQNNNNEGTFGYANQSIQNVELFINNSVNEIASLVSNSFQSTSHDILKQANDSVTVAVDTVIKQLNAEKLLASATELSKAANETKQQLDEVSILLSDLSNVSSQLKDNLTQISRSVQKVCNDSRAVSCNGFDPSQYNTEADFSDLDRLSNESSRVARSLNMEKFIIQANQSLESTKKHAHDSASSKVQEAENSVKDIQHQIDNAIHDLFQKNGELSKIFPDTYKAMDSMNDAVREYSNYVYYAGIGVCCVYLLIIVLYYIGLLFGLCGERPGDGAPCCNTGCGANFLLSGVGITFIFSWILMIICVVLFCVGGPAYTEVCRYFQSHDASQFKVFDGLIREAINLKSYYKDAPPNISFSQILQNCQENKALFTALQLDYIIDLNKTLDTSQFAAKIEDLKNANFNLDNITIINKDLSDSLTNFASAGLDNINFTTYFSELSKQLTVGNLSQMAALLNNIAQQQTDPGLKKTLEDNVARLDYLSIHVLPEMNEKLAQLNKTLTDLQTDRKVTNGVAKLIQDLKNTETNFNANKANLTKEQIVKFIDDILQILSSRVDTLKYEIRETLFGCQNLSSALFTLSDGLCLQIVEPVNGFWFSFGWCLFFFVPCLIFAVLLADQYRRTLEDDKEFDDPNYMIYGNPNPDTIPLTRVDSSPAGRGHPRSGMYNAGYRDEYKRGSYADPPPYDSHMQPGIAAYNSPIDQRQRQKATYPAAHGDQIVTGSGAKSSYAYMY